MVLFWHTNYTWSTETSRRLHTKCVGCARTFPGQSGSFWTRLWVHIAQNTAERLLFRLFSRPASTKQPRIAKGSPPGVHMHVYEVFLYLLDYCARFADLGARFWCQSRDSAHFKVTAGGWAAKRARHRCSFGTNHFWYTLGVVRKFQPVWGAREPCVDERACVLGVRRHISETLGRLKQRKGHDTPNPLTGSCIDKSLRLCESVSGGK